MMAAERERLKEYIHSLGDKVLECENANTIPGRARGRPIQICNAKNVRITGLTLQNGPGWNVHMIYSEQIVTDHCIFRSEDIWNGDGWDPDSSSGCTIFACTFYTGDDSVAIKSGKTRKEMRSDAPAPISGFLTVSVPMAMELPWEARCREELRMWLYGTAILEIRSMGLR